jgi:biofilm PGA synthesis N-glycosyltransferase PgaC
MNPLEALFWFLAAFVVYTYAGYPLLLLALGRAGRRPAQAAGPFTGSVSVILAAHNEGKVIRRRVAELAELVQARGGAGEVIVVSDGSTDGTPGLARAGAGADVRVIELPTSRGKAAALTVGAGVARSDVLVFADARQTWSPDALHRLLEQFADPTVGAVSGDLVIESAPGVLAGVGAYWRYEKWLRGQESRVGSTIGVSGSISAVRRGLFRPIPPGTILDDVYWPLRVAMQGYRVVHETRAVAYDRLPPRVGDEFRRKVRTLSGNLQLLARLPAALVPWHNPVWLQFLSHKIFRLLVPWALCGLLLLSAVLPGLLYTAAFWGQVLFYVLGVASLRWGVGGRGRLLTAAGAFLVLNAAAWLAWWTWITGRSSRSWVKVNYAGG